MTEDVTIINNLILLCHNLNIYIKKDDVFSDDFFFLNLKININ